LWLTFNTTFDLPREDVYETKNDNILEPCDAIAIMAMSTSGPCTLMKDITQWVVSGSQNQPDPNPATRSLRVGHDWKYSHPPRMMQRVAPRRFWLMMEGHLRRVASSPTPSRKLLSTRRETKQCNETDLEYRLRHGVLKYHDQLDRRGVNAKGPEERQRSFNSGLRSFTINNVSKRPSQS